MMTESDSTKALADLRAHADRIRNIFPETTWELIEPHQASHVLASDGRLKGLMLEDRKRFHLRTKLQIPASVENIPLAGQTLLCVINSLYPTQVKVSGRSTFEDNGVPVAAGPALVTLIEQMKEGDNGTIELFIQGPNHQVNNWFNMKLMAPSIRTRFEKLDLLWAQLFMADALAKTESERAMVSEALREVSKIIEARTDEQLAELSSRITGLLAPLGPALSKYRIHLIGHSHIDMNWLWTWPDTVEVIRRDFKSVLDMMDDYPELTFSHSQPATYEVIRELEPEMFEQVKKHVASGRWELTTLQWVEGDVNMASGESQARQLLEGVAWTREHFGKSPVVFHAPDTFGHPGNLPQLVKQSGGERYYHHRCNPGGASQWPAYWWEGQDGSKVLSFSTKSYNGEISAGEIAKATRRAIDAGLPCGLHFHGVGDHGGGPARHHLEILRRLKKQPFFPSVSCSTLQQYTQDVLDSDAKLPSHKGEMNSIFEGCYTTHADIKFYNRAGENLLTTADTLAALAGQNHNEELTKAWRKVLFNQFHDILDGSAIHEAYETSKADFEDVKQTSQRVIDSALKVLQSNVSPGKFAITNPLGVTREEWVTLPDGGGIVARVGPYETIACDPASSPVTRPSMKVEPAFAPTDNRGSGLLGEAAKEAPYFLVETNHFRVYLRRDCGIFVSFFDKRVNRELVGYGMRRPSDYIDSARPDLALNVLQFIRERPVGMSAWQMHEVESEQSLLRGATTALVEHGDLRAVFRVEHKIASSTIVQKIIFYSDLPRVDFETEIDWKEVGGQEPGVPGLKVAFNARLTDCHAWYETPFAAMRRPADGQEYPALRWADVGGDDYGIALLNDSKYGYDILGSRLRLTLLRSPYSPDAIPDVGKHVIRYSLVPHPGNWKQAGIVNLAAAFNQPLLARVVESTSPKAAADFQPRIDGATNIAIACLKHARDGKGRIVRLYDATGDGGEITLAGLPASAKVSEVNIVEDELRPLQNTGGKLSLKFNSWQVRSIRVE